MVAGVVVTVSVEVCVVVPLSVTDAGESVHVGGSLAAAGVMAQLRLTVPEKLFSPTTLMDVLLPAVAPGWIEIDPAVKLPGALKLPEIVYVALATALLE